MTKHDSKTADELIVDNAQALATNINKHGTTLRIENGEIHAFYGSKEHYAINQASRFDLNEIRWLPDIAELVELRKKNAELRFANNEAKEYIESELGSVFITVCPSKPFNPKEHQAIRDLEQQVVGIHKALAWVEKNKSSDSYSRARLEKYALSLLDETEQLKGGSK